MLSQNILQVGNPQLRVKSELIDKSQFGSSELHELAQSLIKMMGENDGIGLAAPQIGLNKRIFVFGMQKNERRSDQKPIPMSVLINPEWAPLSDEKVSGYEACLSIGNSLMAQVPRFRKIGYRGFDENGVLIEGEAQDLHARVIQHEYDHLDGILFLDRVEDTKTFGFYEELRSHNLI